MAGINLPPQPDLLKLSQRDLLKLTLQSGVRISRTEMIPVGRIQTTGAIFDEKHAKEVYDQMQSDFGMTQGALVRAVFKDEKKEEVIFNWMDGLHRIKGVERYDLAGKDAPMKCEVYYNLSDEDMYKIRIAAAINVDTVKFARVCTFINDAWAITPWSHLLSATQAFYLASKLGSGKQILKNENLIPEIKSWVAANSAGFHLTTDSIYQNLLTYEHSDPEVAKKVRSGGSFSKGGQAVTPSQLSMISKTVPHDNHPGIQRIIANYVNSGISTANLTFLLQEIKQLEAINQETVLQVIKDGKWKQKKVEKNKKLVESDNPKPDVVAEKPATITSASSSPIVEEPTLDNAIIHLKAAKNIIVFSYDLQVSQKERLGNQITTMISQLEPKGDVKIQKTEKPKKTKQIKKTEPLIRKANRSSTEFMRKWMDEKHFNKLLDNNIALDEFSKEISELSDLGIYNMAKLFLISLTGGNETKRNIAKNIFDRIPFKLIDQSYINDFFVETAKHIKESLVESVYKREQVRDILLLVTRVIDQNFVSNKIGMSQEAEDLLFDALKSSSSYLQGQEKEDVESWVANHKYLLLEREEI
jgi:hypothetical protein